MRLVIQWPAGVCTDVLRRGPSKRPPTTCTIVRVPCGPFSITVRIPVSALSVPRYSNAGERGPRWHYERAGRLSPARTQKVERERTEQTRPGLPISNAVARRTEPSCIETRIIRSLAFSSELFYTQPPSPLRPRLLARLRDSSISIVGNNGRALNTGG